MARRKKTDGYVVVRLGWEERYGDDWSFTRVETEDEGRILGKPVAFFAKKADAKKYQEELERQERAELNPFLFLGGESYMVEDVTSLSEKAFDKRLEEIVSNAPLPDPGDYDERDWFGWWQEHADGLSEKQRMAVWDLLDKLKFYGVMGVESGE